MNSFVTSPLFSALQNPNQLLSGGAQSLIDLVRPLAQATLSLIGAIADGVLTIASVVVSAIRRKSWPLFWIAAPLVVQLGGIFTFSVAGEYRYLLPFFTVAAALWPIFLFSHLPKCVAADARPV